MVGLMVVVQIQVADLEIREVVVRHGGEDGLEGPVANCPSLTREGYWVTLVVEKVLEKWILIELVVLREISFYEVVKELFHLVVLHLRM
nr:hypothetical protein [Tanacetum cinerariifolium]GEZ04646.1 hypothetical protein [Tanacetum cinerariifolium]